MSWLGEKKNPAFLQKRATNKAGNNESNPLFRGRFCRLVEEMNVQVFFVFFLTDRVKVGERREDSKKCNVIWSNSRLEL